MHIKKSLPCGTILNDKFEILCPIGSGGFAITYKVVDKTNMRPFVLKEYFPVDVARRRNNMEVGPNGDGEIVEHYKIGLKSFFNEAKTLARFRHPNIVPLYDYFYANGTAYFAMPFIDGMTLDDLLRNTQGNTISAGQVRTIVYPILDALQAIHSEKLLHRDIKPTNIFLASNGQPLLIDFGAARFKLGNQTRNLTTILTPGYAPPEQYSMNTDNQGPWTDMYALGAVAFRCLAGTPPVEATLRQDAEINGEIDPLAIQLANHELTSDDALKIAISGCLKLKRKNRIKGVAEFKHVLSRRA
jgi:serine/threonine protein kinase